MRIPLRRHDQAVPPRRGLGRGGLPHCGHPAWDIRRAPLCCSVPGRGTHRWGSDHHHSSGEQVPGWSCVQTALGRCSYNSDRPSWSRHFRAHASGPRSLQCFFIDVSGPLRKSPWFSTEPAWGVDGNFWICCCGPCPFFGPCQLLLYQSRRGCAMIQK